MIYQEYYGVPTSAHQVELELKARPIVIELWDWANTIYIRPIVVELREIELIYIYIYIAQRVGAIMPKHVVLIFEKTFREIVDLTCVSSVQE